MLKLLTDTFTERDGTSFCGARMMLTAAFFLASYRFVSHHLDHALEPGQIKEYCEAVTALGFAWAAKNLSEK
jgi:hypothetical protein